MSVIFTSEKRQIADYVRENLPRTYRMRDMPYEFDVEHIAERHLDEYRVVTHPTEVVSAEVEMEYLNFCAAWAKGVAYASTHPLPVT